MCCATRSTRGGSARNRAMRRVGRRSARSIPRNCTRRSPRRCSQRRRVATAPRLQSHRHGAAHQPRPRAAARGGRARRPPRRMRDPTNLEYDLATGSRGDRDDHVEATALRADRRRGGDGRQQQCGRGVAGAQHAGARREVVVSRGELIEIGGAFRMPDIMARAGCEAASRSAPPTAPILRDYADAIGPRTALLMKVHPATTRSRASPRRAVEAELARARSRARRALRASISAAARWSISPLGPAARADACGDARGRRRSRHLQRRQAARRTAGRPRSSAARDLIARIKQQPAEARAARRQADARGARSRCCSSIARPTAWPSACTTLRLLTRAPRISTAPRRRALRRPAAGDRRRAYRWPREPMHSQIGSGALPVEVLPSAASSFGPADGKRGGPSLLALEAALRAPAGAGHRPDRGRRVAARPALSRGRTKRNWFAQNRALEPQLEAP